MSTDEMPPLVQMFQLLGGFQVSQALYSVAKLGVATALADGPRTIDELATATGADTDALGRIVRDLAPVGIFRTGEGVVEVTPLGATLAEGRAGSLRDVALFWMETHYAPFGVFLHTAVTGESAATHCYGEPFFDWISKSPELVRVTNAAMAAVTQALRAGMFDNYTLPEGPLVADIGGAEGSVLCEFLARDPNRRGIVFDLPEVVPAAKQVLAHHGLAARVDLAAGDFFTSVPEADVYLLSWILHDWDDESCRRILRTIKDSAAPGARLVIAESVMPPDDTPHPTKLTDLTMLAMLTGRERTAGEYEALLSAAGFNLDRIVPTPTPFSFIEATGN